jgi:hypothetical protein
MTSSPSTCGICDVRHISKPSDAWCPECDQGLCVNCTGHHSLQILQQVHPCSLQYDCNLSLCSLQNSLISKTNDGNFWYSEIGMVLWFREAFDKL